MHLHYWNRLVNDSMIRWRDFNKYQQSEVIREKFDTIIKFDHFIFNLVCWVLTGYVSILKCHLSKFFHLFEGSHSLFCLQRCWKTYVCTELTSTFDSWFQHVLQTRALSYTKSIWVLDIGISLNANLEIMLRKIFSVKQNILKVMDLKCFLVVWKSIPLRIWNSEQQETFMISMYQYAVRRFNEYSREVIFTSLSLVNEENISSLSCLNQEISDDNPKEETWTTFSQSPLRNFKFPSSLKKNLKHEWNSKLENDRE